VVRILAKDQLFRLPVLGSLLRAAKCIPVRRPREHSDEAKSGRIDNTQMFSKVFESLSRGDCITIFPEGQRTNNAHT
jgi:1-acyl-sn-glycerol-3-phosphate acyltransferase